MQVTPYIEAAIEGELAKLTDCAGNQDITMNNVALTLGGIVKGWGVDELEIRGRFFDACRALPNLKRGDPWTERHFAGKWNNGMRDAKPRTMPSPNGSAGGQAASHHAPKTQMPKLSSVDLPEWTEPDENGWPQFNAVGKEQPPKSKEEIRRHVYMRDGEAIRCKIKLKRHDGSTSWVDYFRAVRPHDRAIGWQAKKPNGYVDAPYYKQGAINPFDPELAGEPLFITEGEKDADTLADHNLCAISAGSHTVDWSQQVHGRHVVVFGDNDDAGRRFAERQARLLLEAAASVKTYTFPGLDEKSDASDFLAGDSIDKLLEIVANLEELLDNVFPRTNASKLLAKPSPERLWIVHNWIPHCDVTLMGADGGTGKTTLALQLAVACVEGGKWLDFPARQCPVVYLSAEDPRDDLHFRLEKLSQYRETARSLEGLNLVLLSGKDAELAVATKDGRIEPTDLFKRLEQCVAQSKAGLLILDSVADVFGGGENMRREVRSFVKLLRGLAQNYECAVLLLAHPSVEGMKSGRGYSGSTHWNNAVRSRMYFTNVEVSEEDEPDSDLRLLRLAKTNRARKGIKVALRWKDHRFVVKRGQNEMEGFMQQLECERLFLELLAEFEKQGRPPSPHWSPTYAPTVFFKNPKAKGFTKLDLEKAMNVLLAAEKIKIVTEKGQDRKERARLRVVG